MQSEKRVTEQSELAEIVKRLLEAEGSYNVKVLEIVELTERSWSAVVSFDWKLHAWEKHVEALTVYIIKDDSGNFRKLG